MANNDLFRDYCVAPDGWDEMGVPEGVARQHYEAVVRELSQLPLDALQRKEALARQIFMNQGIF